MSFVYPVDKQLLMFEVEACAAMVLDSHFFDIAKA